MNSWKRDILSSWKTIFLEWSFVMYIFNDVFYMLVYTNVKDVIYTYKAHRQYAKTLYK